MQAINPVFWKPANAIGSAASIDYVFEGKMVKINFYWSLAELSVEPKTPEELTAQISTFLIDHPLVDLNGHTIFHLQRYFDDFVGVPDPGWMPPVS